MEYLHDVKRFIEVLIQSEKFHLLCISGPPGWGKTFLTRQTLGELNTSYQMLGSYSTPLALYNSFCEFPDQLLVIDDTAGIFHNPQSMSILNAASWPGGSVCGNRVVKWTSTSELVAQPQVAFKGKIIVLTNFIPDSPQAKAFINRSLFYRIEIQSKDIGGMLVSAAHSKRHFPDTDLAVKIANFLGDFAHHSYNNSKPCPISLRTLELGVELANVAPEHWRSLLKKAIYTVEALPQESIFLQDISTKAVVKKLNDSSLKVEDQFREFQNLTGKSRRAFFYARKSLQTQ